jgi:hypothetical protein
MTVKIIRVRAEARKNQFDSSASPSLQFDTLRDAKKHFAAHRVPRAARTVYLSLLYHRHQHSPKCVEKGCTLPEGKCCPSRALVAELTGYSVRTVTDAIRWLTERGYIEVWVLGEGHDDKVKAKPKYFFVLNGWGIGYVPHGARRADLDKTTTRKYIPSHIRERKKLHLPRCNPCTDLGADSAPTKVQFLHPNSYSNSDREPEYEIPASPSYTTEKEQNESAPPEKEPTTVGVGAISAPTHAELFEEVPDEDDPYAPLNLQIDDYKEDDHG